MGDKSVPQEQIVIQSNLPQGNGKTRTREPWESQPCPLCRALKRAKPCTGHGGGGGGGAGGGEESESDQATDNGNNAIVFGEDSIFPPEKKIDFKPQAGDKDLIALLNAIKFEFATLLELLRQNLLTIRIDPETLTVEFQANLSLLSSEQREILNNFFKQLQTQLKQLDEGSSIDYNEENGDEISFKIHFASKALYDIFVQQLELFIKEQIASENTANKRAGYPFFFSTSPEPSNSASSTKEKENEMKYIPQLKLHSC